MISLKLLTQAHFNYLKCASAQSSLLLNVNLTSITLNFKFNSQQENKRKY